MLQVATNCFRIHEPLFFSSRNVGRCNLESLLLIVPLNHINFSCTGQWIVAKFAISQWQFRFNNKNDEYCSGSIKEFPEQIKNVFYEWDLQQKNCVYMCRWHLLNCKRKNNRHQQVGEKKSPWIKTDAFMCEIQRIANGNDFYGWSTLGHRNASTDILKLKYSPK